MAALISTATGRSPYFIGKPNPLMMRSALNRLEAHSETTVMVGDRMDTDIISGLEAGLRTVLVTTGSTRPEDIETVPLPADPGGRLDRRPGRAGAAGAAGAVGETDPAREAQTSYSSGSRIAGAADLQPERLGAALRLLPLLLASERGEVEARVAVVELLDPPAEGRVGVEDLVVRPAGTR